jgi:rhodanese-related sulfurtransferase
MAAEPGEIAPRALKLRLERGDTLTIVDVREPEEIAIAPFPGAVHIPMGDIPSRISEIDPDSEIVVVCHHGLRSAQVAGYLARMDFARVLNLAGGIDAWSMEVDPAVRRY